MTITAKSYFNGLKSYLCKNYKVSQKSDTELILKEKVYLPNSSDLEELSIKLKVTGEAFAIKLDKYKNNKLFHFLENDSKPWAKRCDFVVFHRKRNIVSAYCIEFKSGSFPEKLVGQLDSSVAWCRSVHAAIKHYTGNSRTLQISKFVFSCHQNVSAYLNDSKEYLLKDHTIRHYLYDEINNKTLDDLINVNLEVAK